MEWKMEHIEKESVKCMRGECEQETNDSLFFSFFCPWVTMTQNRSL